MANIDVYSQAKKKISTVSLGPGWEGPIQKGSVFATAIWHRNRQRAGTASTKTRHEVKGSGRKIYRQKGTGGARHGDRQAPIFVGGGVASGPKPKDWSTSIPIQERRNAIQSTLVYKHRQNKLCVLDKISFPEIKTKQAKKLLDQWEIKSALIVLEESSENVLKSIRNLPHIKGCSVESLNVSDLLTHDYIMVTQAALKKIEERWMKSWSKKKG